MNKKTLTCRSRFIEEAISKKIHFQSIYPNRDMVVMEREISATIDKHPSDSSIMMVSRSGQHLIMMHFLSPSATNHDPISEPTCPTCSVGGLVPGTAPLMLRQDAMVILMLDVSARVCNRCGDTFLTEGVSRKLFEIVDEAREGKVEYSLRNWIYGDL